MIRLSRFSSNAIKKRTLAATENHRTLTAPEHVVAPSISNAPEALARRRQDRKTPPDWNSLDLQFVFDCSNLGGKFNRNLSHLVEQYPHHRVLVAQLAQGLRLHFGNRKLSFQSFLIGFLATEEFIEFLNSNEPLSINPSCAEDLNFQVGAHFRAWLIRIHPGRANNRKYFNSIKSAITALHRAYTGTLGIGIPSPWPKGPSSTEKVSNSYDTPVFNRLVEACLIDMKYVMAEMNAFSSRISTSPPLIDNDGVRLKLRVNSRSKSLFNQRESDSRAMATAKRDHPDWPLNMSLSDATKIYSNTKSKVKSARTAEGRARKIIMSMPFGPEDFPPLANGQLAYFAHFSFVGNSIYAFANYVQINTGWNMEAVLGLTLPLDEHIEQDLLDSHYCVIYSTKHKTGTTLFHRSNMKGPFSVYKVLKFVESVVTQHVGSKHFIPGALWQFIPKKNMWPKHGKINTELNGSTLSVLSRIFTARHRIDLKSGTKSNAIETRKIRTTAETKRREQGLNIHQIQSLQGHKNVDTTATYYDDDSGSSELKNKKIRRLQEQHISQFSDFPAAVLQNKSLADLQNSVQEALKKNSLKPLEGFGTSLNLSTAEIVHLLSPEGFTYIAACSNSLEPTWPGWDQFLSPGDHCRFFNKCCRCERAKIFKEALPWIARRMSDLESLKSVLNPIDWATNYADEFASYEWVFSTWSNQAELLDAVRISKTDDYVLPLTLRAER